MLEPASERSQRSSQRSTGPRSGGRDVMRRKTLDILLTTGGVVVAAVLLIAGLLLTWGHNFATDEVNSQLSAQKIFFPKAGSEQLNDPKVKPYLEQYAGQ